VSFEPDENQKLTYSVRGHAVDVVNDAGKLVCTSRLTIAVIRRGALDA